MQGWSLEDAVREVKGKRPQAHPYLDCWHTMRTRFTEGRTKEVLQTASRIYEDRKAVRPASAHPAHTCTIPQSQFLSPVGL